MPSDETSVERSAVRRLLRQLESPGPCESAPAESSDVKSSDPSGTEPSVEAVSEGVNDVFVARAGPTGERRFVVKFGTFSTPGHLRAGMAAYRLLGSYTDLPVPTVRAFEPRPDDLPPFLVRDHLPGAVLPDDPGGARDAATRDAVGHLGSVVGAFGRVPATATDGYGAVRGLERTESGPRAVTGYDDCAEMFVAYAEELYGDPPDHDALEAGAPAVPDHLRAHRDRLPSSPDPAVVVTGLSPANLLAPGGDPSVENRPTATTSAERRTSTR